MNKTHVTKEGIRMSIFEMKDDHLLSTITIFCNNISSFREALDNPKELKKSEKALYGGDLMSESEATNKLISLTDKLSSYVFEAALRGLNISELLQKAYGRKSEIVVEPKINF